MTIQEAIKLATKHGYRYMGEKLKWDDNAGWFYIATDNGGMAVGCEEKIVLDPKFWKALAKSKITQSKTIHLARAIWAMQSMHSMIDALLEGKTLEEFFNEL